MHECHDIQHQPTQDADTGSNRVRFQNIACRCVEDLEAYPFKPNPTATYRATGVVRQLTTRMACSTDQKLRVFIPVRQPDSTKLGDVIFRGTPTLRCQVGKRALVHFVRPAARSCSSAAAITSAEGLGNRPSSNFCRHRCARHCRCSIAMGREPNTQPHAGRCSSLTKSLAIALCPWARDLWACLAFSLVKTRTHSRGHSGHNSAPAGRSAAWVHERSTVLMQGVSCQLDSYV